MTSRISSSAKIRRNLAVCESSGDQLHHRLLANAQHTRTLAFVASVFSLERWASDSQRNGRVNGHSAPRSPRHCYVDSTWLVFEWDQPALEVHAVHRRKRIAGGLAQRLGRAGQVECMLRLCLRRGQCG
jgi:hypothetical protein